MTNKAVINFLNQVRKILLDDKSWLESTIQPINEAFDMAINALAEQSTVGQVFDEDTISRQALMKEFADFVRRSNNSDFAPTPTWNDAVSLVGSMPSAQPDPFVDADKLKRCRFEYINACKTITYPTPDTSKGDIHDAYAVMKALHPIFGDVEF